MKDLPLKWYNIDIPKFLYLRRIFEKIQVGLTNFDMNSLDFGSSNSYL